MTLDVFYGIFTWSANIISSSFLSCRQGSCQSLIMGPNFNLICINVVIFLFFVFYFYFFFSASYLSCLNAILHPLLFLHQPCTTSRCSTRNSHTPSIPKCLMPMEGVSFLQDYLIYVEEREPTRLYRPMLTKVNALFFFSLFLFLSSSGRPCSEFLVHCRFFFFPLKFLPRLFLLLRFLTQLLC